MDRIEIKSLKPNQNIEEVYLIKHLALMEGRDGRKYLNLIFSDASGDIEGRVWKNAAEISDKIIKGGFAKVTGKINLYQGRRQFVVNKIEKVSESDVDKDHFLPKSLFSPEEMFEELNEIINSLDDFYIKELLKRTFEDKEISRRILTWQAGKSIHHAYQSGLLEHILSCTRLAVQLSSHYQVNKNFVVAGAILHDICKVYELSNGTSVDYTEEGKLVGHLVKGVEIVDRFSYKIKNFPYNTKLHLKHILLSHHGHYEYGSPKIPHTREALLVHHIDLIDSKMAAFSDVIKNDANSGHWSGYVKHLDRMVFKGELPFYPEEVKDEESDTRSLSRTEKTEKKKHVDKELKQNLGSLLEGFKLSKS